MHTKYFLRLATLILVSLCCGLSCSKSDSGYGNPQPTGGTTGNTITISGMTFSPASKTVKMGTVVKWTNSDGNAHTATSNDGVTFDTGSIAGGSSYSYTANTAGTFDYHCTIHGTMMAGTLIVSP